MLMLRVSLLALGLVLTVVGVASAAEPSVTIPVPVPPPDWLGITLAECVNDAEGQIEALCIYIECDNGIVIKLLDDDCDC